MHIQLGIPTDKERCGILTLLLKDEVLASDVAIPRLAMMTERYTGSDLKSMCVTAAIEAVAESERDSTSRTVRFRHFKAAMSTIKATRLAKALEREFRAFGNDPLSGEQQAAGPDDE
ncbi:hypothetical protein CDD83_10481 [Cordyceps sp. RAO-2017]|nr:hypothetical protein CDD83_10481 [Cordyceps sp. RAO-2017]